MEVTIGVYNAQWRDNRGRSGRLANVQIPKAGKTWASAADILNDLGSDGWELVATVPAIENDPAGNGTYRVLLKRPVGVTF